MIRMFTPVLTVLALLLSLALPMQAFAADPFTVSGVSVDARADTAINAQIAATEQGQLRAAELLIERLTLASERASANLQPMTIETARAIIRGQQIGNEKRSANRYLGDITVAFNPRRVKQYIEDAGMNMITTQARPRLVIPVYNGEAPNAENDWTRAWAAGGYNHALTPVMSNPEAAGVVSAVDAVSGNAAAIKAAAAAAGVNQVLIARAEGGAPTYQVYLTDMAIDTGVTSNAGTIIANDPRSAADRVVETLEAEWKEASVNLAANAQTMVVSVLYNSFEDWMRLQDVINTSAQITDARLDALSKDGAMMTLTIGDMSRLSNELSYKGVRLETDPGIGVYLARNSYRPPARP